MFYFDSKMTILTDCGSIMYSTSLLESLHRQNVGRLSRL